MKIQSIYMKNLHRVDEATYTFDGQTYLYGPNGAGKSTILNAIQLALLGYIPGTSKKVADIFKHAKRSPMIVEIRLVGENGPVTIRRRWSGKSTISTSVEVSPEEYDIKSVIEDLELPVFNFGEFAGMTANQLKSWFIQFLPDVDSEIDWKSILTYEDEIRDKDLIPQILAEVEACGKHGVDLVKHINTFLKNKLTFVQSELTRQSATVQSLVFYDEEELGAEDPSDIREQIRSLTATRNDTASQNRLVAQKQSVLKQIADLEASCVKTLSELTEFSSEMASQGLVESIEADDRIKEIDANKTKFIRVIEQNDTEIEELNAAISDLDQTIHDMQSVINGSGVCPFTSSVCPSIQAMIQEYTEKLPEITKQRNEMLASRIALRRERDDASTKMHIDAQTKLVLSGAYEQRSRLKDTLAIMSDVPDTVQTTEEIDKQIDHLQDTLVKLEANEKYNQLIDTLTASKYMLEQDILILKSWIKATDANGLQSRMMSEPFKELADDLDNYILEMMPDNVSKVNFNVSEKANSFSFGLTRKYGDQEVYIPYDILSSGEKCMYTIGLMMYIIDHTNSPLKVILIDDLLDHVDTNQLSKLWGWLSATDIQMIFAGVRQCDAVGEDSPWNIVNVERK